MDESTLSPSARAALETFRTKTDLPLSNARGDAVWRAALAASKPTESPAWIKGLAFAVACAIGAVASWPFFNSSHWAATEEVRASPTARWTRAADAVRVQSGQVRVRPHADQTLAVVTPQLQATLRNSAALFDVSASGTILSVESGQVAWRGSRGAGRAVTGEQVKVPAAASTLSVAPKGPPLEGCVAEKGEAAYESCLGVMAQGSGLAAQTALYELAMLAHERRQLEEAARRFQAYAQRFPEGAFAPEASIARMVDLREAGKSAEAADEAARFLSVFGDEPRVDDVRRFRGELR
jgi:TolA-binding protein